MTLKNFGAKSLGMVGSGPDASARRPAMDCGAGTARHGTPMSSSTRFSLGPSTQVRSCTINVGLDAAADLITLSHLPVLSIENWNPIPMAMKRKLTVLLAILTTSRTLGDTGETEDIAKRARDHGTTERYHDNRRR